MSVEDVVNLLLCTSHGAIRRNGISGTQSRWRRTWDRNKNGYMGDWLGTWGSEWLRPSPLMSCLDLWEKDLFCSVYVVGICFSCTRTVQQSYNQLFIYLELFCYVLNATSNHYLLHFQPLLSGVGFRKLEVYYIMACYILISREVTVYKYQLQVNVVEWQVIRLGPHIEPDEYQNVSKGCQLPICMMHTRLCRELKYNKEVSLTNIDKTKLYHR